MGQQKTNPNRLGGWLAPAIVCGSGAALATVSWCSWSGVVPDSVTYVDAARALLAGQGLMHRWAYWDPVYETCALPTASSMWPPGYSGIIALVASLGLDPYLAGRVVSALLTALLPLALWGLSRLFLPPRLALIASLCPAVLLVVIRTGAAVVSEPGFRLAATLAMYAAAKARMQGDASRAACGWAGASLLAGMAFVFRYVGLAPVICVLGLGALDALRRPGSLRRLVGLGAAAVPATAIVVAVLIRNLWESGTLGRPLAGATIFWTTLGPRLRTIVTEVLGTREVLNTELWQCLRPLGALLLVALTLLAVRGAASHVTRRHAAPRDAVARSALGVGALFVVVYVGSVVANCVINGMALSPRYVTVITPWALWLLMATALSGASQRSLARICIYRIVPILCVLFILCQALLIGRWVALVPAESYVTTARASPAVAWIRAHVPSDEPLLNSFRGAAIARWCPNPLLRLPQLPHSALRATDWQAVDHLAGQCGARWLVHFIGYPRYPKFDAVQFQFMRSLDDAARWPERDPVVLRDAVIYRVGRSPRP